MTWQRWYAWYPVRAYGYVYRFGGRDPRWTWLRWVEWIEGHTEGEWIYRLAASKGREGAGGRTEWLKPRP